MTNNDDNAGMTPAQSPEAIGVHTAGPWSAFTDDSGSRPHTNIVAVVPRTDVVFSLPGHHKNEPNVRLIAAAPDLLTVAMELMPKNICVENTNVQDSQVLPVDVTMGELRRLAAAIARATGEA